MINGTVDILIDGSWERRNVEMKYKPKSTTDVHLSFTADNSDLSYTFALSKSSLISNPNFTKRPNVFQINIVDAIRRDDGEVDGRWTGQLIIDTEDSTVWRNLFSNVNSSCELVTEIVDNCFRTPSIRKNETPIISLTSSSHNNNGSPSSINNLTSPVKLDKVISLNSPTSAYKHNQPLLVPPPPPPIIITPKQINFFGGKKSKSNEFLLMNKQNQFKFMIDAINKNPDFLKIKIHKSNHNSNQFLPFSHYIDQPNLCSNKTNKDDDNEDDDDKWFIESMDIINLFYSYDEMKTRIQILGSMAIDKSCYLLLELRLRGDFNDYFSLLPKGSKLAIEASLKGMSQSQPSNKKPTHCPVSNGLLWSKGYMEVLAIADTFGVSLTSHWSAAAVLVSLEPQSASLILEEMYRRNPYKTEQVFSCMPLDKIAEVLNVTALPLRVTYLLLSDRININNDDVKKEKDDEEVVKEIEINNFISNKGKSKKKNKNNNSSSFLNIKLKLKCDKKWRNNTFHILPENSKLEIISLLEKDPTLRANQLKSWDVLPQDIQRLTTLSDANFAKKKNSFFTHTSSVPSSTSSSVSSSTALDISQMIAAAEDQAFTHQQSESQIERSITNMEMQAGEAASLKKIQEEAVAKNQVAEVLKKAEEAEIQLATLVAADNTEQSNSDELVEQAELPGYEPKDLPGLEMHDNGKEKNDDEDDYDYEENYDGDVYDAESEMRSPRSNSLSQKRRESYIPGSVSRLFSGKRQEEVTYCLSEKFPPIEVTHLAQVKGLVLGPLVGQGAFGVVHQGYYNNRHVAVKFQKLPAEESELTNLACELSLLKSLTNHSHLIQYHSAFALDANDEVPEPHMVPPAWKVLHRASSPASNPGPTFGFVGIITDLAREGSLEDMLQKCTTNKLSRPPSWAFRLRTALELAEALNYLHGRDLIHRDVKAANVLFDHHFHVRLCDYGLAVGGQSEARLTFLGGTEQFMAPEMILADYGSEGYGPASDVFSFGLILGALIGLKPTGTGGYLERSARTFFEVDFDELKKEADMPPPQPCVDLTNIDELDDDELDNELPPPPPMAIGSKGCPQSFLELTIQCLAGCPDDRPSSEDIIEWLKALCFEIQDFDNMGFKKNDKKSDGVAAEVEEEKKKNTLNVIPRIQELPLHRSPNSFEDAIYVLKRFIRTYRQNHQMKGKDHKQEEEEELVGINIDDLASNLNAFNKLDNAASSDTRDNSQGFVQALEGVNATISATNEDMGANEVDETDISMTNHQEEDHPPHESVLPAEEEMSPEDQTDQVPCLEDICIPPSESDDLFACIPDEFCYVS